MKKLTASLAVLGLLVLALPADAYVARTMSLGKSAATAGALLLCTANRQERLMYNDADGLLYRCNGTANVPVGTATSALVPAGSVTAGVTAVDKNANSFMHQTVYTLTAVSLTMTDAGAAGSQGSIQLADYPAGLITLLGATTSTTVTAGVGGIGDTAAVVCSLGSVTLATDNATLTSTEADTVPSTAATLTSGAGAFSGEMTTALIAIQDGTATAKDLWLNCAVPDAGSSANDTLVVAGTVTVTYVGSGDN